MKQKYKDLIFINCLKSIIAFHTLDNYRIYYSIVITDIRYEQIVSEIFL